jgi:hypothetical protein
MDWDKNNKSICSLFLKVLDKGGIGNSIKVLRSRVFIDQIESLKLSLK